MGMERHFGDQGFRIIDLPSGVQIDPETFSEFGHAFAAFSRTRAFDQRVLDHIQRSARPVVIVEGKYDVLHIQTAWEKVRPGTPIPWEIIPSGGFSTQENRGGAEMLRTMLRACCLHLERPVLGLFDHDREGAEQFKSLNSDGFQQGTERTHLKHANKPAQALLLPVPSNRMKFVSERPKSCFLSIEHYYADALLKQFSLADDPIVADSEVFTIASDSRKKGKFAESLPSLDNSEFASFALLFNRLSQLLGNEPVDFLPQSPPAAAFGSQTISFWRLPSGAVGICRCDGARIPSSGAPYPRSESQSTG